MKFVQAEAYIFEFAYSIRTNICKQILEINKLLEKAGVYKVLFVKNYIYLYISKYEKRDSLKELNSLSANLI